MVKYTNAHDARAAGDGVTQRAAWCDAGVECADRGEATRRATQMATPMATAVIIFLGTWSAKADMPYDELTAVRSDEWTGPTTDVQYDEFKAGCVLNGPAYKRSNYKQEIYIHSPRRGDSPGTLKAVINSCSYTVVVYRDDGGWDLDGTMLGTQSPRRGITVW